MAGPGPAPGPAAARPPGPLVLYDIASPLQPRSYAPNPSKARLALGFKGAAFETRWVDILDIASVRTGLGIPAVRKLDDGSDYYTLPMLVAGGTGGGAGGTGSEDSSSSAALAVKLGDSFDIAAWLDAAFPDAGAGRLLPEPPPGAAWPAYRSGYDDAAFFAPLSPAQEAGPHAVYARFNQAVDLTFSANLQLVGARLPFNPATAEETKAMFARRAHVAWDDLRVPDDARPALLAALEAALAPLAALFEAERGGSGGGGGPFLEGGRATYADLVLGGWLILFSATLPAPEWAQLRSWHGGVFGRLHDALQERFFVCT